MVDLRVTKLNDGRVRIEPASLAGTLFVSEGGERVLVIEPACAEFILRRADEVGLEIYHEEVAL